MSRGPELPTVNQLAAIAQDFMLDMTLEDLTNQRDAMRGAIASLRHIDDMPEERPAVAYPRTSGYRPHPDDNPYNAWYWRAEIKGADSGPLAGEEIGIKDVVSVAGLPMMNGARVLEGYVPIIDATIVTRLLDAGATIVGKTACADFSFSGGGHTSGYGPGAQPAQAHPCARRLVEGECRRGRRRRRGHGHRRRSGRLDPHPRLVVRPRWATRATYGLIPYTGCLAIEMTLDHIGPMTNTVENTARMLSVLAGPDPLDPRQRGVIPADYVQDYMPAIGAGCEGIRIGVLSEGFGQTTETWPEFGLPGSEPAVDAAVRAAVDRLAERGAQVTEVSVPLHYHGLRVWFAVAAEGATEFMLKSGGVGTGWFGYYDTQFLEHASRAVRTRQNDYPLTVKNVLLLGEYLKRYYHGTYYAKAQNQRRRLTEAYDKALAEVDVLVLPTIPHLPAPIPSLDADFGGVHVARAQHDKQHAAVQSDRPSGDQRALRRERRPAHRLPDRWPPLRRPYGAEGRRRGGEERRLAECLALVLAGPPCASPELLR